ncbi:protein penguin [Cylas formicarius]|uniref:protein penguin n=1 Tax=Cylas formicarius TaxID=197179 RepID=UPI0029588433|nr:protein penguin [Cylas formicarius]
MKMKINRNPNLFGYPKNLFTRVEKNIMTKKTLKLQENDPPAKTKLGKHKKQVGESNIGKKVKFESHSSNEEPKLATSKSKFSNINKKSDHTSPKVVKPKRLLDKSKTKQDKQGVLEKVDDWNEFKKKKKELKIKRVQARTKDNFDKIQQAKKMGEKLRLKTLSIEHRNVIINQLNNLLKGNYAKFVLAHDTARIVQWLLKYSSDILIHQISEELIPVTISMIQSKYGIHCVKRLLKYGQNDIRTAVIDKFQGHAVKLATHSVSASVLEYAYSYWASNKQKQYLVQEFYGDLYKNSKDPNVKHLRDVYKDSESMKSATLGACKANIKKVLNKTLLDSGLVQTVLNQFLQECSTDDRTELVTELAPHIVVISNSKDGSRAAMQCIWHGSAKLRKEIMKALKTHLVDLSKHEFGHCTVITLLDSIDDTVLLHKIIISEILNNAKDLAVSEWGRKVLLWLVAPANSTVFHPKFVNELNEGRESSTSKKPQEVRRKEILAYSISTLLQLVSEDSKFWLSRPSIAVEILAILKAGSGDDLRNALSKIVDTVTDSDWKIQVGDTEVLGIEDAGIHMTLKKLAQHDKVALEMNNPTFGRFLVDALNDDVLQKWININRCCFILIAIFENNEEIQKDLKNKLKPHIKSLKVQGSTGSKILYKKIK